MAGTSKYVVSGTLPSAEWQNATLIAAASAFAEIAKLVFLSSLHQTPHPFFQQPNPMAVLHADI
jgi:hypothetical protein